MAQSSPSRSALSRQLGYALQDLKTDRFTADEELQKAVGKAEVTLACLKGYGYLHQGVD